MQLVVGAVIVDRLDAPSRLLAARRLRPEGRWEFPGGKVEPGEQPTDALRRELAEELAAEVRLGAELEPPTGMAWPLTDQLELRLWFCELLGADPVPGDSHDKVRWVPMSELERLRWLDADREIVEFLVRQAT